ncbi:hypothetical protein MNBD_ALPHA01-1653 [hydrothermal vent metagenome]|uniref:DUF3035 domain-containing protein n=1 Tax=hydrothermal vent metagenome TaxID=652676 RepID=A0A3B0TGJ3_9ZZZZ
MRNKLLITGMSLAVATLLSACSGLEGPDEFAVLKNPPLIVPPDYHLRPPGDESEVKGAFTPQQIAKRALFGSDAR